MKKTLFIVAGTYALPKDIKFRPFNIFVSPQGLNIQVLSDDEDVLKYYVYEYEYN